MKTLLAYLLVALLSFTGMSLAHSGAEHIRDMACVLNGYGDCPKFKNLSQTITCAMDWTAHNMASASTKPAVEGLPSMFEKRFGMAVPGNHRLLGHGWSLNAEVPKKTLDFLEQKFIENGKPYRRQDVIKLYREWAKSVIDETAKVTNLPRRKASALASLLQNIHLLGDVEPGNTLIEYILSPEEIQKNLDKDLAELLGKDNPTYKRTSRQLKAAVRNAKAGARTLTQEASQKLAQDMLQNVLRESGIGPAMEKRLGKTLGFEFTGHALHEAEEATARSLANQAVKAGEEAVVRKGEEKLVRGAFGKGTAYGRKVAEASMKAASAGGKTVAVSSVVTVAGVVIKDGVWIPALQTAAWEGGAVFVIDAGIACYQYCSGSINTPEFNRKIQDAAIKGVSVGGASAVAVVLGATPGGWVVLGVGFGAYVVTDMALTYIHKLHDSKYLTIDDLADFGITSNTILDIKEDSILADPTPNTILADPEPNTILADPTPNTILW